MDKKTISGGVDRFFDETIENDIKINSKNYCENHKIGVYYKKRAEKRISAFDLK